MTVTQLSQKLKVSRAVIYRVLNNESYVSEELRAQVLEGIKKYGCEPNQMGKGLVLCRQKVHIVALFHEPETFLNMVSQGMEKTMDRFKDAGIELEMRKVHRKDNETELESEIAMEQALQDILDGPKITALVLMSPRNERIEELVRQIVARGTIVATIATDLPNSDRLFFVGQDGYKSGRVVGQLLETMFHCRNVLVFPGRQNHECHENRMLGLKEYYAEHDPSTRLTICDSDMDTAENAYACVDAALTADPSTDAVVVISRGITGVVRALKKHGVEKSIRLIAFDLIPHNEQFLTEGILDVIIEQSPVKAGSMVMETIYNYLVNNQNKPSEILYTDTNLVISEMLI